MGQTTFVKPLSATRAAKAKGAGLSRVDLLMILIVICLLAIGLLAVYSSSWVYSVITSETDSPHAIVGRQMLWVLVGLVIAATVTAIDYHEIARWAVIMMGGTLIMLFLVVLFRGNTGGGLGRNLIGTSVQPSELAKLVIIIYLAVWLTAKQDVIDQFTIGLVPVVMIMGITAGLIIIQPDISAALTIFILGGLLFFFAGGKVRQILALIVLAGLVGWLVIIVSGKMERITHFIAGLQDLNSASYHVKRSTQAIIRGGLFGVGIGKSVTKFTGLPVPWTDSIFSVIAEETGLLGASVVVSLYLILLWRGMEIARRAPDMLGKLLASGMTIWIIVEALVNISVLVNLLPFAGNALPFISLGGSSMVTSMIAIGIILNVSRTAEKGKAVPVERTYSATSDLRRRNGRRSVSRNSHSAGTQA
jgi:cell division protein FtsW